MTMGIGGGDARASFIKASRVVGHGIKLAGLWHKLERPGRPRQELCLAQSLESCGALRIRGRKVCGPVLLNGGCRFV